MNISKIITTFFQLPNTEKYTKLTFRRTSAILLTNNGADITSIKRNGGWKSFLISESYLEGSIEHKNFISRWILVKVYSSNKNLEF